MSQTDFSYFQESEDERTEDRTEMDAMDEDDFVGFNLNNKMAEVYAFVGMHHIFERGTGKIEGKLVNGKQLIDNQ
jgi:hypothetical protein